MPDRSRSETPLSAGWGFRSGTNKPCLPGRKSTFQEGRRSLTLIQTTGVATPFLEAALTARKGVQTPLKDNLHADFLAFNLRSSAKIRVQKLIG